MLLHHGLHHDLQNLRSWPQKVKISKLLDLNDIGIFGKLQGCTFMFLTLWTLLASPWVISRSLKVNQGQISKLFDLNNFSIFGKLRVNPGQTSQPLERSHVWSLGHFGRIL